VAEVAEGVERQAANHSSLKMRPRGHSYNEEKVAEVAAESPSTHWLQGIRHCSDVDQEVVVVGGQEMIGKGRSEAVAAPGAACTRPGVAEVVAATCYYLGT